MGPSFYIPVSVTLTGTSILMAIENIWVPLLINLAIASFILHMALNTWYELKEDMLIVKCGFFFKSRISVNEIKSIKPTRNIQSAPAFSLQRLEIIYGKNNHVLISPRRKKEFIEKLQLVNPKITLKS